MSSIMVSSCEASWKMPLFAMATPVFALAVAMLLFLKEKVPVSDNGTKSQAQNLEERDRFWDLFKNRNLVMAYITTFYSIYGFFVIITWLPYYLESERSMDIKSMLLILPPSCLGSPS